MLDLEKSISPRRHRALVQATQVPVNVLYLKGAVERAVQQVLTEPNRPVSK